MDSKYYCDTQATYPLARIPNVMNSAHKKVYSYSALNLTQPSEAFATSTYHHPLGMGDWRRINAVNVDLVRSQGNVDILQDHINTVTFCDLNGEQCENCQTPLSPPLLKLLQLAQLSLEWFALCQKSLIFELGSEQKKLVKANKKCDQLLGEEQTKEQKMTEMVQELKSRKNIIVQLQIMLDRASAINRKTCPECGKPFMNLDYLNKHLQCSHNKPQLQESEVIGLLTAEKNEEIEGLKKEKSSLKERVCQLEKELLAKSLDCQKKLEAKTFECERNRLNEKNESTRFDCERRIEIETLKKEINTLKEQNVQMNEATKLDCERRIEALKNNNNTLKEQNVQMNEATQLDCERRIEIEALKKEINTLKEQNVQMNEATQLDCERRIEIEALKKENNTLKEQNVQLQPESNLEKYKQKQVIQKLKEKLQEKDEKYKSRLENVMAMHEAEKDEWLKEQDRVHSAELEHQRKRWLQQRWLQNEEQMTMDREMDSPSNPVIYLAEEPGIGSSRAPKSNRILIDLRCFKRYFKRMRLRIASSLEKMVDHLRRVSDPEPPLQVSQNWPPLANPPSRYPYFAQGNKATYKTSSEEEESLSDGSELEEIYQEQRESPNQKGNVDKRNYGKVSQNSPPLANFPLWPKRSHPARRKKTTIETSSEEEEISQIQRESSDQNSNVDKRNYGKVSQNSPPLANFPLWPKRSHSAQRKKTTIETSSEEEEISQIQRESSDQNSNVDKRNYGKVSQNSPPLANFPLRPKRSHSAQRKKTTIETSSEEEEISQIQRESSDQNSNVDKRNYGKVSQNSPPLANFPLRPKRSHSAQRKKTTIETSSEEEEISQIQRESPNQNSNVDKRNCVSQNSPPLANFPLRPKRSHSARRKKATIRPKTTTLTTKSPVRNLSPTTPPFSSSTKGEEQMNMKETEDKNQNNRQKKPSVSKASPGQDRQAPVRNVFSFNCQQATASVGHVTNTAVTTKGRSEEEKCLSNRSKQEEIFQDKRSLDQKGDGDKRKSDKVSQNLPPLTSLPPLPKTPHPAQKTKTTKETSSEEEQCSWHSSELEEISQEQHESTDQKGNVDKRNCGKVSEINDSAQTLEKDIEKPAGGSSFSQEKKNEMPDKDRVKDLLSKHTGKSTPAQGSEPMKGSLDSRLDVSRPLQSEGKSTPAQGSEPMKGSLDSRLDVSRPLQSEEKSTSAQGSEPMKGNVSLHSSLSAEKNEMSDEDWLMDCLPKPKGKSTSAQGSEPMKGNVSLHSSLSAEKNEILDEDWLTKYLPKPKEKSTSAQGSEPMKGNVSLHSSLSAKKNEMSDEDWLMDFLPKPKEKSTSAQGSEPMKGNVPPHSSLSAKKNEILDEDWLTKYLPKPKEKSTSAQGSEPMKGNVPPHSSLSAKKNEMSDEDWLTDYLPKPKEKSTSAQGSEPMKGNVPPHSSLSAKKNEMSDEDWLTDYLPKPKEKSTSAQGSEPMKGNVPPHSSLSAKKNEMSDEDWLTDYLPKPKEKSTSAQGSEPMKGNVSLHSSLSAKKNEIFDQLRNHKHTLDPEPKKETLDSHWNSSGFDPMRKNLDSLSSSSSDDSDCGILSQVIRKKKQLAKEKYMNSLKQ